jgi:hypothetical protein
MATTSSTALAAYTKVVLWSLGVRNGGGRRARREAAAGDEAVRRRGRQHRRGPAPWLL